MTLMVTSSLTVVESGTSPDTGLLFQYSFQIPATINFKLKQKSLWLLDITCVEKRRGKGYFRSTFQFYVGASP